MERETYGALRALRHSWSRLAASGGIGREEPEDELAPASPLDSLAFGVEVAGVEVGWDKDEGCELELELEPSPDSEYHRNPARSGRDDEERRRRSSVNMSG